MVFITYIGHASFLIENEDVMIITDPWVTPGTFDKSWFQYPRNEFMKEYIESRLKKREYVKIFIYIYLMNT